MNKIFYIHSNILAICCYQTVKNALTQNEKVIIITDRRCEWPFFQDRVIVYNFADIFLGEDLKRVALHNLKAIKDYVRYRRYLCHLNKVVSQVISGEDFFFYMPSMAKNKTAAFAYNKHCKGYYYVDEGSLAYLPQELINQQFSSKMKNAVKRLFKIEDHCHYEIKQYFKGTVSITNEAFQWNKDGEKIVNPIDECILDLKDRIPSFDDVIVTAFLSEDIDSIIKSIDYTVDYVHNKNKSSRIGIKLHPYAITYNRENVSKVYQYIKDSYDNQVVIIPKEVSIEAMSLIYHTRLYSLFQLSSLILYGLLFNSSEGFLIRFKAGNVTIDQISTVDEYYKQISVVNFNNKKE